MQHISNSLKYLQSWLICHSREEPMTIICTDIHDILLIVLIRTSTILFQIHKLMLYNWVWNREEFIGTSYLTIKILPVLGMPDFICSWRLFEEYLSKAHSADKFQIFDIFNCRFHYHWSYQWYRVFYFPDEMTTTFFWDPWN